MWTTWNEWNECQYQDGTEAFCWKTTYNTPRRQRFEICRSSERKKPNICNSETLECDYLPACKLGKEQLLFMIIQNQIIISINKLSDSME